jgi:hypothetical protein
MRSGTGWAHSKRRLGSKWVHCLHACSGVPHWGQLPSASIPGGSRVPHSAQRETTRWPSMAGRGGPAGGDGFPLSRAAASESR